MGNVTPSLGELSAIDQVIDSLQIQRGNPNLKSYMSYYTELNYEFRKGLFYVNALGAYEYQPDAIMDEKYLEGNKIIQTWDNQKNWQRVVASANLRVGPIKDILQFSVNGGMNHYMSNGNTYTHRYTNWWCEANVSATWKKWSLWYMVMTNWNWFKGETMSGGENIQGIQLGYRHKDLMVGLRVINRLRIIISRRRRTGTNTPLSAVQIISRKVLAYSSRRSPIISPSAVSSAPARRR